MNFRYPYGFSDYHFDEINEPWNDALWNNDQKFLLTAVDKEIKRELNDISKISESFSKKASKGAKVMMKKEDKICLSVDNYSYVTVENIKIPKANKVVIVQFSDGTEEKAVCDENDVFDLKTAISICIMKKLAGGSSNYHKILDTAVELYNDRLVKEEEEKAEQNRIKARKAKNIEKKAKRVAKKREEQIEMQKEAYLRAMNEKACGKHTEMEPVGDNI